MTELPKSKPRKDRARPGDLIVPITCVKCGHGQHVWFQIDKVPELQRDELGQLIRDGDGNPVPVLRQSYSYLNLPRIHPAYTPEMEGELKLLYERSRAEREFAERNKKPRVLAEVTA